MIDQQKAEAFLRCGRIALVGASDDKKNFGGAIGRALTEHGIEFVPVNPTVESVDGRPSFPTLKDVPGRVDGVLVVVSGDAVLDIIRMAAELGLHKVWLFKGIGGAGAASEEAVALCEELGLDVVAGACPLMFLEPVGFPHRLHKTFRRLNGSVSIAA